MMMLFNRINKNINRNNNFLKRKFASSTNSSKKTVNNNLDISKLLLSGGITLAGFSLYIKLVKILIIR